MPLPDTQQETLHTDMRTCLALYVVISRADQATLVLLSTFVAAAAQEAEEGEEREG
jgi:hypothetical protein